MRVTRFRVPTPTVKLVGSLDVFDLVWQGRGRGRPTWFSEQQRGTDDVGAAGAVAVGRPATGDQGGPVRRGGRDARRHAPTARADQHADYRRDAEIGRLSPLPARGDPLRPAAPRLRSPRS